MKAESALPRDLRVRVTVTVVSRDVQTGYFQPRLATQKALKFDSRGLSNQSAYARGIVEALGVVLCFEALLLCECSFSRKKVKLALNP